MGQGQLDSAGTASPADQAAAMLNAAQSPETPPEAPAPAAPEASAPAAAPQQAPAEPVLSEFAQGVLKDIPEAERAVVAKYLPQWDANVTRRFQQVQSTYAPIQPLLDDGLTTEDLEVAAKLYMLLDSSPQEAVDMLVKQLGLEVGSGPGQPQTPPAPGSDLVDTPTIQLPPDLEQQLKNINQFMEATALQQQQQAQAQVQAQQDADLEQYLTLLRQEKGDFDEDFVLTKMMMGMDGADAVEAYRKIAGPSAASAPQAPPVLSGGPASTGVAPVTAASDAERKALVTQMLSQVQNNAQ